jgi:hypothetical protein
MQIDVILEEAEELWVTEMNITTVVKSFKTRTCKSITSNGQK